MRILLIEDNEFASAAIARVLRAGGFVCDEPHDVKRTIPDAFSHLATHEYAAIVTDIVLPGWTGVQGVPYLRQRHHGPIVAVTSDDLSPDERALFDGYLRKPSETDELAPMLRRLLRSAML